MAIYRETARGLFGEGGTAAPAAKPVHTRAPQPAAKPFTRDTSARVAPTIAPAAETSFMAAPAYGERTTTARRSGSATRPLIIAGIAGVIALGVGAVVLMNNPGEGVETAAITTPLTATPTPLPTPAPVAATPATPMPIPATPEVTSPVASTPTPARRTAAPAARRAAATPAPVEEATVPTGPQPYSSVTPDAVTPTPAPTAATPATPAPPLVIMPEPVAPAPAPAPIIPDPVPVPQ